MGEETRTISALQTLNLSFVAEPESVESVRRQVLTHLEPLALPARAVYGIELVIEEVVMNLAWHAFPGRARRSAELCVTAGHDSVTLGFVDDGVPFDPSVAVVTTRPKSIEEARPGGLGLTLLRGIVKTFQYSRTNGFNRFTLTISREG